MIRKISILGCGWLGLPLAKYLTSEYQVKGSTTKAEKIEQLRKAQIEPFLIKFDPNPEGEIVKFLSSDLLIINIPPSLRTKSADYHVKQMQFLQRYISDSLIKSVIYISSTSVYPDLRKEVTEEDVTSPEQSDNKTLFEAEEVFRKDRNLETTIIRCGGLAGYDRNLVKHFAGNENLKLGNAPVNLIHRDDVIGIIHLIIKNEYWNETLNICAPQHPLRRDLYPYLAQKYDFPVMSYDTDDSSDYKIISTKKLQKDLNYNFKYPHPSDFLYS